MGDRGAKSFLALATAVAALALPAVASGAPLAKSTFNDSVEGWKIVGDTAGDPERPDFVPTGGVTGGFAQVTDQAVGGVMYWRAPAKFRGNQIDAYDGTLAFALTQSAGDNQFEADDVVLEGGGLTLSGDGGASPPVFPLWGKYTMTLHQSSWADETNGDGVTGREMRKVLRDLDEVRIRAEYRTGDDTDGLDSVRLTAG
jgi:hypothetical protein